MVESLEKAVYLASSNNSLPYQHEQHHRLPTLPALMPAIAQGHCLGEACKGLASSNNTTASLTHLLSYLSSHRDTVMESLEKAIYLASSNDITAAASAAGEWTSERIAALGLTVSTMLKGTTTSAAKITAALLKSVTKGAVQIVISLVLAFMMVWDMPSIKAGVETLRSSRLAPVYDEVAPVLSVFGNLFGKALEVQVRAGLL